MSNRHLARTIAMQTLFEWDFRGQKVDLALLTKENIKEFAPDFDDNGFTMRLIKGVKKELEEINAIIAEYAPEWPIEQITVTDRNVLRIGIYELKYSSEVPPKVAINEAIELAKTFGGESSGKFVNGVLGTIYKQMEERGEKISTSKAVIVDEGAESVKTTEIKSSFKLDNVKLESNPHTGRVEVSAGGVVYHKEGDVYRFALILDGYDKWALPKGHIEQGESVEIAALEEVKEETGLRDVALQVPLGTNVLTVNKPDGVTFEKPVHYFLIHTSDTKLNPHSSAGDEIKEAKWMSAKEALEKIGYKDAKEIFIRALHILGISN